METQEPKAAPKRGIMSTVIITTESGTFKVHRLAVNDGKTFSEGVQIVFPTGGKRTVEGLKSEVVTLSTVNEDGSTDPIDDLEEEPQELSAAESLIESLVSEIMAGKIIYPNT